MLSFSQFETVCLAIFSRLASSTWLHPNASRSSLIRCPSIASSQVKYYNTIVLNYLTFYKYYGILILDILKGHLPVLYYLNKRWLNETGDSIFLYTRNPFLLLRRMFNYRRQVLRLVRQKTFGSIQKQCRRRCLRMQRLQQRMHVLRRRKSNQTR